MYLYADFKTRSTKTGGQSWTWRAAGLPVVRLRFHWNPPWYELGYRKHTRLLGAKRIVRGFVVFLHLWKLDALLEVQRKAPPQQREWKEIEVRGVLRRDEKGQYLEINKGRFELDNGDGMWRVDFGDRVKPGQLVYVRIPRNATPAKEE